MVFLVPPYMAALTFTFTSHLTCLFFELIFISIFVFPTNSPSIKPAQPYADSNWNKALIPCFKLLYKSSTGKLTAVLFVGLDYSILESEFGRCLSKAYATSVSFFKMAIKSMCFWARIFHGFLMKIMPLKGLGASQEYQHIFGIPGLQVLCSISFG